MRSSQRAQWNSAGYLLSRGDRSWLIDAWHGEEKKYKNKEMAIRDNFSND
tara:strand:- start:428 stop:577 length:150 start_codon:yes stop_codon:yes gene_type:complete